MPDLFGEETKEEIEAKKESEKQQRERQKEIASSISDSAFWLAYCGMQKAIRQGDVLKSKKMVYVCWLKNPWLIFRRLHTVLFEDIGPANPKLILEIANFYKSGKSYKNIEDVLWFTEQLALSNKSRDGDLMNGFIFRSRKYQFVKDYAKEHNIDVSLIDDFSNYDKDIYDSYSEYVDFAKNVIEKMSKEKQAFYIPYLMKYVAENGYGEISNQCDSPSHERWFKNLIPYTVLDTHGAHGKLTMSIFKKKMISNEPDFLKKYNFIDEKIDYLPILLFALEGSSCVNYIKCTGIHDIFWQAHFMDNGLISSPEQYNELIMDFKPILQSLKNLREWVFEKKIKGTVDELLLLTEDIK